jgi:hypothetical protein
MIQSSIVDEVLITVRKIFKTPFVDYYSLFDFLHARIIHTREKITSYFKCIMMYVIYH